MGNTSSKGVGGIPWISTSGASRGQESGVEKGDPDGSENVEYRDLVLSALPVLRRVSDGLSRKFGLRDRRSDFLNNIQSSAFELEGHLDKIKRTDDIQRFEDQISQLAYYLEEIFGALQIAGEPDQEDVSDGCET